MDSSSWKRLHSSAHPSDAMSKLRGFSFPRSLPDAAMTPRSASLSLCQQCLRTTPRRQPPRISRITLVRAASSSTPSQHKPIVLEQPDKFRPPSHPARLNRRPPRAYNQGTTAGEKESQKSRAYPHMFPDRGSFMHWFLTDRWIHLWITMVSFHEAGVSTRLVGGKFRHAKDSKDCPNPRILAQSKRGGLPN